MRLVGFCVSCRKVKQVTVNSPMPGGAAAGVCRQCEDKPHRGPAAHTRPVRPRT